jgi:hypothetical protein
MNSYRISKTELLKFLPELKQPDTKQKLSQNTYNGLMAKTNDPHHLLSTKYDGSTGVINTPSNIDFRKHNAHRRMLLNLGKEQSQSIMSINMDLARQQNIMESGFLIALGAAFTTISTLVSIGTVAMSKPPIRVFARINDQVWQLERFGKIGTKILYVNYILLIDPFRIINTAKSACEWVIHEERMEVV